MSEVDLQMHARWNKAREGLRRKALAKLASWVHFTPGRTGVSTGSDEPHKRFSVLRAPKLVTLESSSGPCQAPPKKRSRKGAKTQRSEQSRDPKDLCDFASLRDLFL